MEALKGEWTWTSTKTKYYVRLFTSWCVAGLFDGKQNDTSKAYNIFNKRQYTMYTLHSTLASKLWKWTHTHTTRGHTDRNNVGTGNQKNVLCVCVLNEFCQLFNATSVTANDKITTELTEWMSMQTNGRMNTDTIQHEFIYCIFFCSFRRKHESELRFFLLWATEVKIPNAIICLVQQKKKTQLTPRA